MPKDPQEFPRATVPVFRLAGSTVTPELRGAICERELTIVANGEPLVRLLCSAAALRELAHGFLYSEGVVGSLDEIAAFELDQEAMVAAFTLAGVVERPGCPTISSGFGGKVLRSPMGGTGASVAEKPWDCENDGSVALAKAQPRSREFPGAAVRSSSGTRVDPAATALSMGDAVQTMEASAPEYARTRGMHCSALFRGGEMLGCFEDIGRHNTFDKLAGHCLLSGIPMEGALLATTGRVSGEMMRKAVAMGVAGVASCSGPTDVAIALAREAGVALAGYAKTPGEAVLYGAGRGAAWEGAPQHEEREAV